MRPIDADALRAETCAECTLHGEKCLGDDCDWDSIYHIDHAPTVDAIPVEWIRNVQKNWILTREDMEFRDWLIERWQKEQEAR